MVQTLTRLVCCLRVLATACSAQEHARPTRTHQNFNNHRGLQLSDLETPTNDLSEGGDSSRRLTFVDLTLVVSEFGRRIDAHHLLGARIARRVWLKIKQQTQTVLASSSAAGRLQETRFVPSGMFGCFQRRH